MLKNGVGEMAQWKKKLDTKAHNLSAVAPGPREHCGREVGKNVALGNADSGRVPASALRAHCGYGYLHKSTPTRPGISAGSVN